MTLDDLARRAVACRAWRWLPGMVSSDEVRVCRVDPDGYALGWSSSGYVYALDSDALPDLTDPATLGCLLALVREAHGDVVWLHDSGIWTVRKVPDVPGGSAAEVEALIVALEGAP